MNNCKGFSLIEVMTSLMILSIMTIIILPTLATVYQERSSIQQEQRAIIILEKVITEWIYEGKIVHEMQITEMNTIFTISSEATGKKELTACISWNAANNRSYERCESGKK
ncbi:hypothetical protein BKP37_15965 [Anaerobacillus alkalilacustris]|uniref:Prepilin-type N-terminal cleavage/methylation domain-containing protein n=1 Tax=Anaerobacillus alkalilacustris TaxID=393763 RepID=A0A1S2LIK2_9BACI|nr:competence type IV pilus minor pilin ComGE [Anaerobacillus alkalilacustris]OIJ11305.1 hypothetical protein BKP37_15965 [Anaerobacillus alkalilacustris]